MKTVGLKRGVVIVDEPADRRDPRDGQPARRTTTTCSPRASRNADFRQAAQRPGPAAAQPRHPGAVPARLDVQARDRHGRPGGRQDHGPTAAIQTKASSDARRAPRSTTGTTGAGACATSTAASATRATRSSTSWPASSASTASATGPSSTASAHGPASTCPARSRASSPPTTGSRTRSGQPIFPGETYQAGIGQGYDAVTPHPAHQRLCRAGQRRQALPAADRPRGHRPGRRGRSRPFKPRAHPQAAARHRRAQGRCARRHARS